MNAKKILVPVTLADGSGAALAVAARLAEDIDASIVLLHVLRRGGLAMQKSNTTRKMHQLVEHWQIQCPVEIELRWGHPVSVIAERTAEWMAEMVVMSTHGYHGFFFWAHRHTARHVLRRVNCPVWLVSPCPQDEAVMLSVYRQPSLVSFSHPWRPVMPNSFPSLMLNFYPPG